MATKTASKSSSAKPKSQARRRPPRRSEQTRSAVETAVDFPVGAALELGDRVVELVEPFTGRSSAQKQLKSYGTQLRRSAKRTERRGAGARRKAATEARKTRDKVEREARKRVDRVSEQLATLR